VVLPSSVRVNYGDAFRSDVLLDDAGNVYVASATSSANFPGLGSGLGASYRGGTSDALVCKLTPSLDAVVWASLLGGTNTDAAYSVQRDRQGRVYVCGGSVQLNVNQPNNFPVTPGAYQPRFQGGGIDGFAARLSADGRTLEQATFIGTDNYDQAQFLQLDATGNVYLFGQTLGAFPLTPGLFGTADGSLFIQKLSPDLTTSLYSTAFGNRAGARAGPTWCPRLFWLMIASGCTSAGGAAETMTQGNWLGGSTTGLPVTSNAAQKTTDGSDFYLAQFAPGMTGLDYATFFGQQGGAEHVDGGTSRFDKRGIVYQAGVRRLPGQPGLPGAPRCRQLHHPQR
jgi:hypothetical protein